MSEDAMDLDEEVLMFALLDKKISKKKRHHHYWVHLLLFTVIETDQIQMGN
jgi:hypothetical protein